MNHAIPPYFSIIWFPFHLQLHQVETLPLPMHESTLGWMNQILISNHQISPKIWGDTILQTRILSRKVNDQESGHAAESLLMTLLAVSTRVSLLHLAGSEALLFT